MAVRRKCIKAGKEKVGDSARISARQVGREREDRWGKVVRHSMMLSRVVVMGRIR